MQEKVGRIRIFITMSLSGMQEILRSRQNSSYLKQRTFAKAELGSRPSFIGTFKSVFIVK